MLLRYFRSSSEPAHLASLRSIPVFASLKRHELETLNRLLHRRSYVADEVIFDQDEEGQAVYFVLQGTVEIRRQGYTKAIADLGPGLFFGERALMNDAPRIAQARAKEDSTLAVLFREDFLSLLKTHPEVASSITEYCNFREAQQPLEPVALPQNFNDEDEIPGSLTWVGIFSVTSLLLLTFKKILWLVVPFLLALILYYVLAPIAKKMVLSGLSTKFAAISLSGAFLCLMAILVVLFYPLTLANALIWQAEIVRYLSGGALLIDQIFRYIQQHFAFLGGTQFGEDIYLKFRDVSEHFSDKYLGGLLLGIATWLPSILLTPIITFFLLKDGASLRKMLGAAVPNAFFEKTLYLIHAIDKTARLYFLGLLKITVIDACLMALGFSLLGLHHPFLLALLVALLCWIPYIGPLTGYAMITIIAATDFPGNSQLLFSIFIIFSAMRVLDDLILLPGIVGRSLQIHPLVTILMFMIGESIAGIAGLMLAIPILAIVMILGETLEIILTDKRLRARHRHSQALAWRAANQDL